MSTIISVPFVLENRKYSQKLETDKPQLAFKDILSYWSCVCDGGGLRKGSMSVFWEWTLQWKVGTKSKNSWHVHFNSEVLTGHCFLKI